MRRKSLILVLLAGSVLIYCLTMVIRAPTAAGLKAEAERALPKGTGSQATEAFLKARCDDWSWDPEDQTYRGTVRNVPGMDIFQHVLIIEVRMDPSGKVDVITTEDFSRGL